MQISYDYNIYVNMPKRKHKDFVIIIKPFDLVWLEVGSRDVVVPRIPENWKEVRKLQDAITNGECRVRGYVPREVITKEKFFF